MFDASAFNADVEAIAHYVLIVAVEFAAEESSDVLGFDGVDDNLTIARKPFTEAGFGGPSGIHTRFKKWLEGTSNPHAVRSSQGRVRQLPLFPAIALA